MSLRKPLQFLKVTFAVGCIVPGAWQKESCQKTDAELVSSQSLSTTLGLIVTLAMLID